MIERPPKQVYDEEILAILTDERAKEAIDKALEEYLYWDKAKYRAPENCAPEAFWSAIKFKRSIGGKSLSLGRDRFQFYVTDTMMQLLHEFDMELGGKLGSASRLLPEDKNRYLLSSIMEESIASSMIEGAVTTRRKAKEMLRKKLSPQSLADRMVLNNFNTIKFILANREKELNMDMLLEIHSSMCNGTLEDAKDQGRIRVDNEVNVVDTLSGEVVHRPPDFMELEGRLQAYFDLFNTGSKDGYIHPVIMASSLHFLFGYLHPFVDGNGRTARAILYWYLLKEGYWLMEYLSISRIIYQSKTQYERAYLYTENDELDLGYFIHYQLRTLHLAMKELKNYIERKVKEKVDVEVFQRLEHVNPRQAQILVWMEESPDHVLTVNEVSTRLVSNYQTARRDLIGLEQSGYLTQMQLDGKSRGYVRSNRFLELISRRT